MDANDVSNANANYGSASGFSEVSLFALQKVSSRIPFVAIFSFLFILFVYERSHPSAGHATDLVDECL